MMVGGYRRRPAADEDADGVVVLAVETQLPAGVELRSTRGATQQTRLAVTSCTDRSTTTNYTVSGAARGEGGKLPPMGGRPKIM